MDLSKMALEKSALGEEMQLAGANEPEAPKKYGSAPILR